MRGRRKLFGFVSAKRPMHDGYFDAVAAKHGAGQAVWEKFKALDGNPEALRSLAEIVGWGPPSFMQWRKAGWTPPAYRGAA